MTGSIAGEQVAGANAVLHGEIDENVVPGTVHLVDLDHSMSARHSKAQKDVVLVPSPSNDPDDPLNWYAITRESGEILKMMTRLIPCRSPRRKVLSLVCMCVYVPLFFTIK